MQEASLDKISKVHAWVLASRPKTLPAAVAPVLVGTALALKEDEFNGMAAVVALVCSVLLQIGANFVNDLYDFLSGSDTEKRSGPTRMVANKIISVREMKIGIAVVFAIAFMLGMYLVHVGGWPILLIGVLSIIAGIGYTAGPYPLAYNGLGDVFVFIFFGFVGTVGSFYVQTLKLTPLAFWASVPVGALVTNILVVNNYRDIDEDRENGKNTLAVKFGRTFTRVQYVSFMILSYVTPLLVYFTFKRTAWVFLPVLTFPIGLKLIKMIFNYEGKQLNETLALTAKLSAIYGFLFAIGLVA